MDKMEKLEAQTLSHAPQNDTTDTALFDE